MADKHSCPACPVEIRDLYATASNFIITVERGDSPERVARKLAALKSSVKGMAPIVDAHFKNLDHVSGGNPGKLQP